MEVRVFPCLGRAGVAAKDYPLGTNIIQEHPLLVWKRKDRISLVEAFSKASPEEKQKVLDFYCPRFSLSPNGKCTLLDEGLTESGVPATLEEVAKEIADSRQFPNIDHATTFRLLLMSNLNAHSFGGSGDDELSALFDVASKVPHTCCPNVVYLCQDNERQLCYRSIKAIPRGELLQYSYLCNKRLLQSTNQRRRGLAEDYLFVCRCPRCAGDDMCRALTCPHCHAPAALLRSDDDHHPGALPPPGTTFVFPTVVPRPAYEAPSPAECAIIEAIAALASPAMFANAEAASQLEAFCPIAYTVTRDARAHALISDGRTILIETDREREGRLARHARRGGRSPTIDLELTLPHLNAEECGRLWGDGTGGDDCWDIDGELDSFVPSRDDPDGTLLARGRVAALHSAIQASSTAAAGAPPTTIAEPRLNWHCIACGGVASDSEPAEMRGLLAMEGRLARAVLRCSESAPVKEMEALLQYCRLFLGEGHWATAMLHAEAAQQWARMAYSQLHHTGAFLDRHSDYMAAHPPSVSSSCMLVKELPRSFAAPPDDNEDNPASDGTPPDELSSDALGYPTPPPLDFTEREREAVVGLLPAGPWVRGTDELRAFDEAVRSLAALNLRTAPVLARLPRQACYNRALLAYGKALIFLVRSVAHSSLYMHFLNRSHVGTDVPTLASNFCYAMGDYWGECVEWLRHLQESMASVLKDELMRERLGLPDGDLLCTCLRKMSGIMFKHSFDLLRASWGAECRVIQNMAAVIAELTTTPSTTTSASSF